MTNKKKLYHRLTKEKKSKSKAKAKAKAKAKIIKTVEKLAKNQALNSKTID